MIKTHHFNKFYNQRRAVELSLLNKRRSIPKVKKVFILHFWAKGIDSVEDGVRTGLLCRLTDLPNFRIKKY